MTLIGTIEESNHLNQNKPIQLPKWFVKVESFHDTVNTAAQSLRGLDLTVQTVGQDIFKQIEPVIPVINATSFIGSFTLIFAIPKLIVQLYNAFIVSDIVTRIKYIAKSILSSGAIASALADTITALKTIGVVAKEAFNWMPIVGKILYPMQFISLGLGFYKLTETVSLRSEMNKVIDLSKKEPRERRIEALAEACHYVIENKETLQKKLGFAKETCLGERGAKIISQLSSSTFEEQNQALVDGEAFMKKLRTRANTELAFQILSTIAKVAAIIITGILLFTLPTPLGFIVATIIGVVGVLFIAGEKLMINRDPFSPTPDIWYEKVFRHLREGIHMAARTLYKTGTKSYHLF